MNETTSVAGLGGGMWMFGLILLFLIFGGGNSGFGWGGNGLGAAMAGNMATQNDVQRGFDALNLQNQTRDISNQVTSGTAQTVAATNSTFHDTLAVLNDKYSELQRDIAANAVSLANLQANQQKCCCDVQMGVQQAAATTDANIAQNRYEAAMNTAAINANTTAQTQKILDAISQNKIESLQAQVNQLQLAQATSGMLKFPNSWTYGAGPFPPIFGCCNGNVA